MWTGRYNVAVAVRPTPSSGTLAMTPNTYARMCIIGSVHVAPPGLPCIRPAPPTFLIADDMGKRNPPRLRRQLERISGPTFTCHLAWLKFGPFSSVRAQQRPLYLSFARIVVHRNPTCRDATS